MLTSNKIITRFVIVYFLFFISICISIAYTEYKFFDQIVFNNYVWSKILTESFKNSIIIVFIGILFKTFLNFLRKDREYDPHNRESENKILRSEVWANYITVILFSLTLLPLRTIVTTYYLGSDSTYFTLAFVHFDTPIKILISITVIFFFVLFLYKKYSLNLKQIIVICILLALPPTYNIINTQNQNFDVLETRLISIKNALLIGDNTTLINEKIGKEMEPLAEKLLRVARNDTELAIANEWMAETKIMLGDFESALKHNSKSLSLNEYSPESYFTKSRILMETGDFNDALLAAEKCLSIAQRMAVSINKATIEEGRCESQIALIYHFRDSKNGTKKDDLLNAKKHMERAISIDPEQIFYKSALTEILISYAIYHHSLGQYESALKILNPLIEKGDLYKNGYLLSKEYSIRGAIKSNLGDKAGALADLEKSIEIYPEDNKPQYAEIALVYYSNLEYKKAIDYFEKALNLDIENKKKPSNMELLLNQMNIHAETNNKSKIIDTYTRMISINPNNFELYAGRANAYSEDEDHAKAISDFEKVITLLPEHSNLENEYQTSIAIEEFYLGKYGEMCKRLRTIYPDPNNTVSLEVKNTNGGYDDISKKCTFK